MITSLQLHLAKVFLKIFLRNRQAILFSLFFPLIFIGAFSFSGSEPNPFLLGINDQSKSEFSSEFIKNLEEEDLFTIIEGDLDTLKESLVDGEIEGVISIPKNFKNIEDLGALKFFVDASQTRQASIIKQSIDKSLVSIERKIRNISPLFLVELEDVKARSQRYIDFLLPGLLAFMIMNLSIAGSGFNIVEYRRRGILKRLFVTPIKPKDFIVSIVLARMGFVITKISRWLLHIAVITTPCVVVMGQRVGTSRASMTAFIRLLPRGRINTETSTTQSMQLSRWRMGAVRCWQQGR